MLDDNLLFNCNPTDDKIYISGPMSGIPEHNFPAFHNVATFLRTYRFNVHNPAETTENVGKPWEVCLRRDLQDLLQCNTIVLLPGWRNSRGALVEQSIAQALGMKHYISNFDYGWSFDYWEPNKQEGILEEAQRVVMGDRRKDYDHPLDNFRRIGKIWEVVLGHPVTPEQVGLCMIGLKLARGVHSITRDTLVDISGYALTIAELQKERMKRESQAI